MKIILMIFIFTSYASCVNDKQLKHYTSVSAILEARPIKNMSLKNYSNGKHRYLLDSLENKNFGNLFEFFQNSEIKRYSFIVDYGHSTYDEFFDSTNHRIKEIQGTPIVYKTIDADKHHDSLTIEYLISDFSWDKVKIELSDNGKNFIKTNLTNHPTLKFIKSASLTKSTKSLKRFYLLAKFEGKLRNSEETRIYYDTIDLTKNK